MRLARDIFAIGLCILVATLAHAEVIELEGTIKSIDAEKREITIGRKTLDVAKKCQITIDGVEATLADLKADQDAVVEFDDEIEVAKSIRVGSSDLDTDAVAKALKELQGEWLTVEAEENKNELEKSIVRRQNRRVTVKGSSWTMERVVNDKIGVYKGKFDIDPKKKSFDWIGKGPMGNAVEWIGIYELNGDTLKVCYRYNNDGTAKRPKDFSTSDWEKPNALVFYTLKRQE